MATLYRSEKIETQKLPKAIGATLLTQEEYYKKEVYKDNFEYRFCDIIDDQKLLVPNDYGYFPLNGWYLRAETPSDDGSVSCSDGGSYEPDWYDYGPDFGFESDDPDGVSLSEGIGTRPVLIYEPGLFAAGLKPGDVIDYEPGLNLSFTVLSDTKAIFNSFISNKVFDENTNDYEKSAIKQRIDKWFEKNKKFFDGLK